MKERAVGWACLLFTTLSCGSPSRHFDSIEANGGTESDTAEPGNGRGGHGTGGKGSTSGNAGADARGGSDGDASGQGGNTSAGGTSSTEPCTGCVVSCEPGVFSCNGLQPTVCDANGAPVNNGAACSYLCTESTGKCGGSCRPGAAQCADQQPQTGNASAQWVNSGSACGTCTVCQASSTSASCQATSGGTCEDGDGCTMGDKCQSGKCVGTAVTCQPIDDCHTVGSCTANKCPEQVPKSVSGSKTFSFSNGASNWTVPDCVTQITIDAYGAQGGDGVEGKFGEPAPAGGKGGHVVANLKVTPGSVLQVNVGGVGTSGYADNRTGGFNGGGVGQYGAGGGATVVRIAPFGLTQRILVAGGGGGAGSSGVSTGGVGGGATGGAGCSSNCNGLDGSAGAVSSDGAGGSQTSGGVSGVFPGYDTASSEAKGSLGLGGYGGHCITSAGDFFGLGGGGGGGYYGGGGGCESGAGGGSSYIQSNLLVSGSKTTNDQGVEAGDGKVTISW